LTREPWILGVGYSHNGAACLLRGSAIHVAIQEERLTGEKRARIRHYRDSLAVRYCLEHAGIGIADLDALAVCWFSAPSPPPVELAIDDRLPGRYLTVPHHLGHAHGVLATSGFEDAAILIIDGQGGLVDHLPPAERAPLLHGQVPGQVRQTEVISIYRASGDELRLIEKHSGEWMPGWTAERGAPARARSLRRFGSLGGMYSAVAELIFGDPMEAGKVMGLAPYGRATIPASAFYTIDDAGRFHYDDGLCGAYRDLEPWPANQERHAELAASVQAALERAVLELAARARRLSGAARLCYAGGVALNAIANERVCTELGFDDVYLMPAAEDSGTAIGAAYHAYAELVGRRARARLAHDRVGRVYASAEIDGALARVPGVERVTLDGPEGLPAGLLDEVVERLCAGELIGWFVGGSELGPRALGQRSILCDARRANAKARLNDRVKHREAFRPFAPVILRDAVSVWFDAPDRCDSPAMLRVMRFAGDRDARVPAAAHVDRTGRVQTVTAEVNPELHALLARFAARTGVPLLVNTSLNVAGEPIVETPEDALWCLLATELDALVLEDRLVRKPAGHVRLLDLRPRLLAREVRLGFPIVDGALRWRAHPDSEAAVTTATPYGELTLSLRAADVGVLALCDGSRTGWDVLEALRGSHDLGDVALVRRLCFYRRAQILALDAPGPGAAASASAEPSPESSPESSQGPSPESSQGPSPESSRGASRGPR
jgi:carbamoyltransferase